MKLERLEPVDLLEWSPARRPLWSVFQAAHLLLGWKPPHLSEFKNPPRYFGALEPKPAAREVEALYDLLKLHSESGGRLRCQRMRIGQREDVRPLRRVRPVDAARFTRDFGIRVHQHVFRLIESQAVTGDVPRQPPAADWAEFLARMYAELKEIRGASPIYSDVLRYAHSHRENTLIREIDWSAGYIQRYDVDEPTTIKSAYRLLARTLRDREGR